MNQDDIYFKKIDLPNFQEIRSKSLEFVKNDDKIFQRKLSSYYIVDFKKFTSYCPLLVPSFNKLDLEPYLISIFVMYDDSHGPIHIDLLPPYAKVLMPLLNTEGSKTTFYGNCRVVKTTNPKSGIKSYRPFVSKDIQARSTFELDGPTVIRSSVPHDVKMNKNNVPRISMQVETNPDCVTFLNPLIENDVIFI
jgi:hypothetical protein